MRRKTLGWLVVAAVLSGYVLGMDWLRRKDEQMDQTCIELVREAYRADPYVAYQTSQTCMGWRSIAEDALYFVSVHTQ